MKTFSLTLHKTYYSMGFFNVPVVMEDDFGDHDEVILLWLNLNT